MKSYRKHHCQAAHRAYRAMANCIWPNNVDVVGDGPYVSLSTCQGAAYRFRGPTVHLYPDAESAEHAKRWIDETGCGGRCTKQHEVIQLVLPTKVAAKSAPDGPPVGVLRDPAVELHVEEIEALPSVRDLLGEATTGPPHDDPATPCPNRSHSPRLNAAGVWRCPDCHPQPEEIP